MLFSLRNAFLFLIIILAIILRVILLDKIPPGVGNDEINIILNAQSILNTGQNIPGVVTGVLFNPSGDLAGGIHSELSSLLIIPGLFLFGLNWFSIKLPFILASLGILLILYFLGKNYVNTFVGVSSAVLAALNPWLIHFGRSAYESILSSFF